MFNEEHHELYHVIWRPATLPLENPLQAGAPHASALEFLGKMKTPSKPAGAYRPPGARGTATPLSFKREDEGGAAFVREMMSGKEQPAAFGPRAPRVRTVPGAEPVVQPAPGAAPAGGVAVAQDGDENLSKAALKNKKKREAKKAKDAEAKATGLAPNGDAANGTPPHGEQRSRSRSNAGNAKGSRPQSRRRDGAPPQAGRPAPIDTSAPKQTPNGTPAKAPEVEVTSPGSGISGPNEKKIRSLLKKLRAIDDLKMRQAGGEKLEGTQVLKIGTEEQVRQELAAVGYHGD